MDRFQSGFVDIGRLQRKTLKEREGEREIGGALEHTQNGFQEPRCCEFKATTTGRSWFSWGLRLQCDLCPLMHASSRRSYGHVIDQAFKHRFSAMDATLRRLATRKSPRFHLTGSLHSTLSCLVLEALQSKERGSLIAASTTARLLDDTTARACRL